MDGVQLPASGSIVEGSWHVAEKLLAASYRNLPQSGYDDRVVSILRAWAVPDRPVVNILIRVEVHRLGPRIVTQELQAAAETLFDLGLHRFIVAARIVTRIARTLSPAKAVKERLALVG